MKETTLLDIRDLYVTIDGQDIIQGLSLTIKKNEVHAIMGPNGSGKSTLVKALAGHPDYQITKGEVNYLFNGKMVSILDWEPEKRAWAGFFLGFQYPVEIPGVSNKNFLETSFREICRAQGTQEMDPFDFDQYLQNQLDLLKMDKKFLQRPVNDGLSGGEKKRNEILQMAILKPKLALLDETDSGLDIDALKVVAEGINALRNQHNAIILVTHYQRLLNYITPDFVHILLEGKLVKTGDASLALKLEEQGYKSWLGHER